MTADLPKYCELIPAALAVAKYKFYKRVYYNTQENEVFIEFDFPTNAPKILMVLVVRRSFIA